MSIEPRTSANSSKPKRHDRDFGLPLLQKELLEQSVRPRTYLIRSIYAAILLCICFLVLQSSMPYRATPFDVLGVGAIVFWTLVGLQEFGLYLALPVLACGTIVVERERKTLELLLLTQLSVGTIVLEKFLSKLIPALNLLLLSAPMLAFSYSLGGITVDMVLLAFCGLVLTTIRLTAVGIMCSAGFANTSRALTATYGLVLVVYVLDRLIVGTLFSLLFPLTVVSAVADSSWIDIFLGRGSLYDQALSGTSSPDLQGISIAARMLVVGLSSISVSALLLYFARVLLFKSSFQLSRQPRLGRGWFGFRREPRTEKELLHRFSDVPEFEPIRWREGPRRSGAVGWWIRNISLTLLGMFGILIVMIGSFSRREVSIAFAIANFLFWIILTLRLVIQTAGLFVQERSLQTMEVLATTPMTSESILRQKMFSVYRTIILAWIALGICVLCRLTFTPQISYFLASAFIIGIYPPIIAWQAMVCGMRCQNGAWAILKTLIVLTARCLVPFFVAFMFALVVSSGRDAAGLLFALMGISPLSLLVLTQVAMEDRWPEEAIVIPLVSVISSIILLCYLRFRASALIETALGRQPVPEDQSVSPFLPTP